MSGKLKDLLAEVLPSAALTHVTGGYDIVGDVCLVKIADELIQYSYLIGTTLLNRLPNVRLVARICGNHHGIHRTVMLEKVAGDGGFATIHHEFGLRLRVVLDRVYFSPRSAQERCRIARQVAGDDRVLVMFSGIGALPLMIARYAPSARVYGVEINPDAHRCGLENLKLNRKLSANVVLQYGDASDFETCSGEGFDRIVMPLPLGAERYLDSALSLLAKDGYLHFYTFSRQDQVTAATQILAAELARNGRKLKKAEVHKCGLVSPRTFRICIDGVVGK